MAFARPTSRPLLTPKLIRHSHFPWHLEQNGGFATTAWFLFLLLNPLAHHHIQQACSVSLCEVTARNHQLRHNSSCARLCLLPAPRTTRELPWLSRADHFARALGRVRTRRRSDSSPCPALSDSTAGRKRGLARPIGPVTAEIRPCMVRVTH